MRKLFLVLGMTLACWAESAGGINWTAPAGWKAQPDRPMRAATYVVPAAAGDKEDGECAVFYFGPGQGGGVDENVRRWMAQFEGGQSATPKTKAQTVQGLKVTTVEHAGTFLSGAPMAPVKTPKPGYRLIGSIVEAPGGSVFFKLTGPAKTVEAAQASFDKMIGSVKK